MKQTLRGFAVGLFTAAAIMLVVEYFSNGSEESLSDMPIEDVVSQMADQGYRVLTEKEYISLSMTGEAPKEKTEVASESNQKTEKDTDKDTKQDTTKKSEEDSSNSATDKKAKEDSTKKEEVKSYTLTIKSGMPSSEISNALEANGIINNSDEFIAYLEDEGYAVRIQLGDFKLTSDMSHYEIAEALTK
ncbi:hypothetical protein [Ornithinibacillus scapharcae]|uniref:hypothetical protein n=1 Tax=Ornithinibacillus scapharcae TaxID=1147159 RepID=UPI000225B38A|nr:hypothetical protein [Ornithinibacillus scapharcae]